MRKIIQKLQYSGLLSAWDPGIYSSFRPEKMHFDLKKDTNAIFLEERFFLQDVSQAPCFETWDITSGHIT